MIKILPNIISIVLSSCSFYNIYSNNSNCNLRCNNIAFLNFMLTNCYSFTKYTVSTFKVGINITLLR